MPASVVRTIHLRPEEGAGLNPRAVSYDFSSNTAYLANSGSDNVTAICGESATVKSVIKVGQGPSAIATNSQAHRIYVACKWDETIYIIDGETNTLTNHFEAGVCSALKWDPTKKQLFACNIKRNTLDIYNALNARVQRIKVGHRPVDVAIDRTRDQCFIANHTDGTVSVIDLTTAEMIDHIYVAPDLTALALDEARGILYMASDLVDAVYKMDANTLRPMGVINLPSPTTDVDVNQDSGTVYLSSAEHNEVFALSRSNLLTIKIRGVAHGLAVNTKANLIYTANGGAQDCNIINGHTHTLAHTTFVGSRLQAVSANPNTGQVFALSVGSNQVSIIPKGGTESTTRVPVGAGAWSLAVNRHTNRVYTANTLSTSITMVHADTGQASGIEVDEATWYIATNEQKNRIYTITNSGQLVVIDGHSCQKLASVSARLAPVAVNGQTGDIFVASRNEEQILVYDGTTHHQSRELITEGVKGHDTLLMDEKHNRLFAVAGRCIWALAADTGEVLIRLPISGTPHGIAYVPESNRLYVSDNCNNMLRVYDAKDWHQLDVLEVGHRPWAVTACSQRLYVANLLGGTLSVVNDS